MVKITAESRDGEDVKINDLFIVVRKITEETINGRKSFIELVDKK